MGRTLGDERTLNQICQNHFLILTVRLAGSILSYLLHEFCCEQNDALCLIAHTGFGTRPRSPFVEPQRRSKPSVDTRHITKSPTVNKSGESTWRNKQRAGCGRSTTGPSEA